MSLDPAEWGTPVPQDPAILPAGLALLQPTEQRRVTPVSAVLQSPPASLTTIWARWPGQRSPAERHSLLQGSRARSAGLKPQEQKCHRAGVGRGCSPCVGQSRKHDWLLDGNLGAASPIQVRWGPKEWLGAWAVAEKGKRQSSVHTVFNRLREAKQTWYKDRCPREHIWMENARLP